MTCQDKALEILKASCELSYSETMPRAVLVDCLDRIAAAAREIMLCAQREKFYAEREEYDE